MEVEAEDSDSSSSSSSSSSSPTKVTPVPKSSAAPSLAGGRVNQWTLRVPVPAVISDSSSDESSSSSSEDEDSEISDLDGEEEVDKDFDGGNGAKDLMVKQEPVPPDPSYKGDWSGAPAPGSQGFNRFAARVMWNARVARDKRTSPGGQPVTNCPPLQPHQEAVAFLLHPQSAISRLLVDHPTGSGKTREMIAVLNNYFLDPRPKVPIFPKEPVCRNFYLELLRWPSRYRDFFACLRPQDAARASRDSDWRRRRSELWDVSELSGSTQKELCLNMREVLEMKGWFFMGKMRHSRREAFCSRFPDEVCPAAPLRALRYTSAGGRHAELRPDGLPVSALLKVAFNRFTAGGNAYSNKVVIMDEVHNLVRQQTQYGEQLSRLRSLLAGAQGTVLAGFTGTPILNEASEGRQLLDIIKGKNVPPGDGGFLSSFPMRPANLFPTSLPQGIPDSILTPNLRRQFVRRVTLGAEPLKRYDVKRQKGLPERRLRAYCNMCVHFGSFHTGRNGSRHRVLADMANCAPKLFAIASEVCEKAEKALVLISRSSGLEALLEHLRERSAALPSDLKFGVATMEELAEFNAPSNLRGENFRVLVADAAQCSEGVSFFAVRRVHLAEVPATPSGLVQAVGRAIRMYGHRGLPVEDQTVITQLWVAEFPRWMRSSLGALAFRAQRRRCEPSEMVSGARRLLRRLLSAGIPDLETLKKRLDAAAGGLKGAGERPALTPAATASFFEQVGLWDEAKALRLRAQKGPATARKRRIKLKVPVAVPKPSQVKPDAEKTPKPEMKEEPKVKEEEEEQVKQEKKGMLAVKEELPDGSAAPLTARRDSARVKKETALRRRVASPQLSGPVGDEESLASLIAPKAPSEKASAPEVVARELAWQRDPLVRIIEAVHSAATAAQAEEQLFLSPWTAEQEALQSLSRRSREFVPALSELRRKAVDRAILMAGERRRTGQTVKQEPIEVSDGESSGLDFAVSGSDREETAGSKPKEPPPLVLPPGWRTEVFRRKGRDRREFVDPNGKRYGAVAEARKAINAERTRQNMAQKLKQKYADALSKKRSEPNEGLQPVKQEVLESPERSKRVQPPDDGSAPAVSSTSLSAASGENTTNSTDAKRARQS
mmetsp:Transcript_19575/g.34570  ORF Transcript_19575/g.34570 Transcript_19575/m.34570 type:complete len:1115 (+) Transcript_19575:20-3364(+)